MRFSHLNKFKIGKRDFTLFLSLAETQRLEGMTSRVIEITSPQDVGKHYVFGDIEGCNLAQAVVELKYVQKKYVLSDIFIVSDAENSFRFWCWSKVDFKTYLKILLDIPHLDYNFFYWTVLHGKSTLRTSDKVNRPTQKIVCVLYSYPVPIPKKVEQAIYDTGIEKRGLALIFKDGKAFLKGEPKNG